MRGSPDRCPTHPRQYFREEGISGVGKSKAEIARLLGVSRKRLNDFLTERKPVTPEVAMRLAGLFGARPKFGADCRIAMTSGTPAARSMSPTCLP